MEPTAETPRETIWQRKRAGFAFVVFEGAMAVFLTAVVAFSGYGLTESKAESFLSASLTVTVGLLVGVFLVGDIAFRALASRHPIPTEEELQDWALVFVLALGALSLGLFFAAVGLVGAWPAPWLVGPVTVSWLLGPLIMAIGIYLFLGRSAPGLSHSRSP